MKDALPAITGGIVSDVLSMLGIPGGSVAGAMLQKLIENRLLAAKQILIQELKRGDVTIDTAKLDGVAPMVFRYIRAAEEGTARLNLRLMAKVIAGQKQEPTLTADQFLYHASIVAALRREEIILLGTLYRHWMAEAAQLDSVTRTATARQATKSELVPHVLSSEEELIATMAAITRTGLLIPGSAFSAITYSISPLMVRLNALAPFEAAIEHEANSTQ